MPGIDPLRIVSHIDLTSLRAIDTPDDVRALCSRAVQPVADRPDIHCAAVCVWPNLAAAAAAATADTPVRVACVAGAFPLSQSPLDAKLVEIRSAVADGADEIDIAINRGLFLGGAHDSLAAEIRSMKEACGPAHLKVILETCDLPDDDAIRLACRIAADAGADFLKTSTGMGRHGATTGHTRILLEEARAACQRHRRPIGVKPAGGIRTTGEARDLLALGDEFFDPATPADFRLGASSLLDDLKC